MSTPPFKSDDPALAAWQFAEKVLDEEDDDARLAKLTPDELRAELDAQAAAAPTRPWSLDQALAATAEGRGKGLVAVTPPSRAAPEPTALKIAPVAPIQRPLWRNVAIALAASFVLFIGVDAAKGPFTAGRGTAEEHVVRDVRQKAFAACAAKDWGECRRLLDDAARHDPDGEDALDVRKAREAIAAAVGTSGVDAGGR